MNFLSNHLAFAAPSTWERSLFYISGFNGENFQTYLCAIFVPGLSLLTSIFFRAQHSELYNIVDIIFLCWLKCFLFERRLCYNDIDEMKKHILVDDHNNDFTYLSILVDGFRVQSRGDHGWPPLACGILSSSSDIGGCRAVVSGVIWIGLLDSARLM